jgi:hypothetical protein
LAGKIERVDNSARSRGSFFNATGGSESGSRWSDGLMIWPHLFFPHLSLPQMVWPQISHRVLAFCAPDQLEPVRAWHGDVDYGCFRVAATRAGATGEGSRVREAGPRLPVSDVAFRVRFSRQLRPVVPRQTCFPSLGPWAQYSVTQQRRWNRGERHQMRTRSQRPILGRICSLNRCREENSFSPCRMSL